MNRLYLILSGVLLSPFIYLAVNNQPIADDFVFPIMARDEFWKTQWDHYLGFSGRYMALIFQSLHPIYFSLDNLWAYKLTPLLLIITYILILRLFLKKFFLINSEAWISSILLTIFYMSNAPSLWQGIYWWASSTIFDYGNIAWLIGVVFGLNYFRSLEFNILNRVRLFVIFLCFGFSEVGAISLFVFNAILAYIYFFKSTIKHKESNLKSKYAALFGFVSFLGFSANLMAPGNIVKSGYSNSSSFIEALFTSFDYEFIDFIINHFDSILLLTIFSIMLGISSNLKRGDVPVLRVETMLLLSLGALFATVFLSIWFFNFALSINNDLNILPQRTLNALFFPIIILHISVFFWLTLLVKDKFNQILLKSRLYVRNLYPLPLLFLIVTGENYVQAIDDVVSGKVSSYSEEWDKRFEVLRDKYQSNDPILFDNLAEYPLSISSPEMANLRFLENSVNGPLLSGIFGVALISENPLHKLISETVAHKSPSNLILITNDPGLGRSLGALSNKMGFSQIKWVRTKLVLNYEFENLDTLIVDSRDESAIHNLLSNPSTFSDVILVDGLPGWDEPLIFETLNYSLFKQKFSYLLPYINTMDSRMPSNFNVHFGKSFNSIDACDDSLTTLYNSSDVKGIRVLDTLFQRTSASDFELSIIFTTDFEVPTGFNFIAHLSPHGSDINKLTPTRKTFGFDDFSFAGNFKSYCRYGDVKIWRTSIIFNSTVQNGDLTFGIWAPSVGVLDSIILSDFIEDGLF